MKYTTKVNALKIIVELYPEHFSETTIPAQLVALRRESDLMEVIGNPRNQNMHAVVDAATERFKLFCTEFSVVEIEIYNVFKSYYSLAYAKKVAASARNAYESENLAQLMDELVAIKGPVPEESAAESSTAFSM